MKTLNLKLTDDEAGELYMLVGCAAYAQDPVNLAPVLKERLEPIFAKLEELTAGHVFKLVEIPA